MPLAETISLVTTVTALCGTTIKVVVFLVSIKKYFIATLSVD